jgi:hypothetical protein
VEACGFKDRFELGDAECRGLLAHYVLAGGEHPYADLRMRIGMGGNIDRVDVCRGELVEGFADCGYTETICVRLRALGRPAPDGGEGGGRDGLQSLSEAGGGAARPGYAPANELQMVVHFGALIRRLDHFSACALPGRAYCQRGR